MAGDSAVVGLLRVLLTASTAEFDAAMKKASDSAKVWSKDLATIGQQATQLGTALTKTLTLPLVGLGVGAVKAASDFESAFAGVRKTVDGVVDNTGQLTVVGKQISDGLREMAKDIPVSVEGLASVAEAAGQLGIKKEDILQFTRTMADLGVATNLTSDQAATATAQIQNIFGAAGKDVDRFGATLVALGNDGASTEKDIIEMSLRIAGAGHQVGLTQDQVLAFANALSSVGINAEAGGSAISRVFLKINDAVMSGGPALAEFARVAGMSSAAFKKSFETDAAGATTAFISGLGRLKGEGENVNQTIEGMIGKNIIIKDTLLRASGSGDLLTRSLALGAQAWQDNTALTNEANERYKTLESQVTMVWNQIKDLGITIGTALLPMLKGMLDAIKPLIEGAASMAEMFAKLPMPLQMTAVGIGLIAAAAGPAIFLVGQFATAASTMFKALAAGGILSGMPAMIRAIGLAALASAPLIIGLGTAIASVTAIIYAGVQAWNLYKERQEQARLEGEFNKSHQLALAEASKVAGRAITDLAEAQGILAARAQVLQATQQAQAAAQARVNAATQSGIAPGNRLTDTLRNLQNAVRNLTNEQREQLNAGIKAGLNTTELTAKFNELFPSVKLTEQAVDLYKEGLKKAEQEAKKHEAALEKGTEAQKKFTESIGHSIARFDPFKKALQDSGQEIRNLSEGLDVGGSLITQSIEETAEAAKNAGIEFKKWADAHGAYLAPAMTKFSGSLNETKKHIDENKKSGESWKDSLSELAQAFSQLAQVGGDSFSGLVKAIGTVVNSLELGLKAGETFTKGFAQAMVGGGKELAKGMAGMATGLVSGFAGIMGATSTSSQLTNAIGGAISGAAIGASIGAAIAASTSVGAAAGPWGAAAGAIVGIFIGVFRGRSTRQEMERVGEEWGVAISEGTAKKIKQDAKKIFEGASQAARVFNLSEILKDAGGLDTSNLDAFTAKLRDVFVMLGTGQFDAAQAAHVLEENWANFAKVGTDASGRLSVGLREILKLARENGVATRAMTDYTRQQSSVAIEGFGGIVAASSKAREGYTRIAEEVRAAQEDINKLRDAGVTGGEEMWKAQARLTKALTEQQAAAAGVSEELSDLGIIAVGVYAAAIKNGLSHAEAIEAAGPAIMDVTQAYRDLGINIDSATFRALSLQAELQQRNPNLIRGVNSLSQSFIALSNTNSLNEDSFRAMERVGVQMFDRLMTEVTALGGDASDALLPMQDYLHEAEEQARLLGIPLSENTQRLIDQSRELGIWQATGEQGAENVTDAVNELVKAVRELVDEFRRVPPRVNTVVTTTFTQEGTPPELPRDVDYSAVPNFARGSHGVQNFGAGTLAMLHGREAVVPEDQLMNLSSSYDSAGFLDAIKAQTRELKATLRSIRQESRLIDKYARRDAAMGAV